MTEPTGSGIKRLGTSGGHILYYFGSKDRLLLAALRWSESALAEERRALLGRRTAAERKLDDFLRLYLPRGPRDPRWTLWIELWARTPGNPELQKAQRELGDDWQRDLEVLLTAGAARGRFAPLDAPARASELLALLECAQDVIGRAVDDPAKAQDGNGRKRLPDEIEHRDAVHHRTFEQEPHVGLGGHPGEPPIGESHRPLVRGDHMAPRRQRSFDMVDSGPAVFDVQRRCLHDNLECRIR